MRCGKSRSRFLTRPEMTRARDEPSERPPAPPLLPRLQIPVPESKELDEIPGRYGGERAPQTRPDRPLARGPRVGSRCPPGSTAVIAFQKVEGKQPHAQKGER